MASTPAFASAYKNLNPAQKQAVDTIEGPVMVVAGPGTGKTQILTLRIANILLSTDTPPDGILALTFTEAGVDAMKRRLLKLIGPTAYKVNIYTFHGFCNDLIHSFPQHFPRIIGSQPLTDIESVKYIRGIIDSLSLDKLKPFGDPHYYVQDVRSAIATLKREGKTPEDVANTTERLIAEIERDPESIHSKGAHAGKMKGAAQTRLEKLRKERELGTVFAAYEQILCDSKRYDYEDMIGEVVRALSGNDELLTSVRDQFLYILADEHQDANGAQNALLELLSAHDEVPNLFIVGDEKQAIFRFQGAMLDNFDHFQKLFPRAVLIRLVDSYRSGQQLLDAAHALMQASDSVPAERHPQLKSKVEAPHVAALEARMFTSEELELAWAAQDIRQRIAEGVPPGDIAVIFRTNADAEGMSRALSREGVLHTLDSKSNIFGMHVIAQLITYLRLCTHIGNDEYLAHVLHVPWLRVRPHDAYRAILYAQKKRLPYIDTILSREHLKQAGVRDDGVLFGAARSLQSLAEAAQEESARDFFDKVLHESGFLAYVLARADVVQVLNAVRGLAATLETLSATARLYTGRDFVRDLDLYEEYGIEVEPDTIPKERTNAVHLTTAHRSKGLEYEYVYIIHARNGKWGNRTSHDTLPLATLASTPDSDIEDERRLFYVALTRAKQYVSVSYGISGGGRTRESTVTQFMEEIDPSLVTITETEAFEASVPPEAVFALRPPEEHPLDDRTFLVDVFIEQGLSATALNNYLVCPWRYFYRNLLRVPEKPTSSSLYGNALHDALRHFRDLSRAGEAYQPLETLLGYLQTAIDNQGFTPGSYDDALKKGTRALTDWHQRNIEGYEFNVQCERKFEVYLPLPEGDPQTVLLRGTLDVLQFNADGTVTVIDYKTGKHKSRNEILGATKNATGDYKRQLDFYCILMELKQMDRPTTLALEFIEPDAKDKTATHEFAYDEGAVGELKETIARVAGEIYALSFWDSRCDDTQCTYCALRETIR
jgi:DNA helicase-2/ATP-dependent DNA helicase PcrA